MTSQNNTDLTVDPYNGYSSSPDSSREYISFSKDNQKRWLSTSENTIQEFIDKLPSFNGFHDAFSFLADKRHHIAADLKQRNEEGLTDCYGTFRREGEHSRQSISAGDGEHFWRWQKNRIFELTYKIVNDVREKKDINKDIFENNNIICLTEKISVDNRDADYYSISIKSPFIAADINNQQDNILSVIELFDFNQEKKFNLIRIEYTPIYERRMKIYNDILNQYYESLLHWNKEKGPYEFFKNSANLAYLLSHLKLVKQGNVGIAEWLIRALAFKNHMMLGRFNHEEGISWDFKAILTPDKEEFVKWFYDKAFLNYSLLDKSADEVKFTYLVV